MIKWKKAATELFDNIEKNILKAAAEAGINNDRVSNQVNLTEYKRSKLFCQENTLAVALPGI